MTIAPDHPSPAPARRAGAAATQIAGFAGVGAGAVHAAAIGIHAEHSTLSRLFVAVAVAQLATGLVLLLRGGRGAAAATVIVNAGAVTAWAVTRVVGISWIDGLERAEPAQFTDTVCAVLGLLATAAAGAVLVRPPTRRAPARVGLPALALGGLAVVAMVNGATHAHAPGAGDGELAASAAHSHGDDSAHAAAADVAPAAADVAPAPVTTATAGDTATAADTTRDTTVDAGDPVADTSGAAPDTVAHSHDEPVVDATHPPDDVTTRPYDPALPIDLSGVDGVTLEQQAFAENLVAVTVTRLPQWSDPAVAEGAGFRSIGDGATGHEHYIQWDWIDDDVWLDPDAPESLVFEPQPDGTKKLVSAMYMLPGDMPLTDVPDYGGRLMQWHVHDNLCFTDDPEARLVRGLTQPDGTCLPPLVKLPQSPMIHVWITPTPCGPFAALEGVGAGSVRPGEERWCDHAHGAAP